MKSYKSIADIKYSDTENFNMERFGLEDDVRDLLLLLEEVNPCSQRYYIKNNTLLVTYMHRLNLLNFTKKFRLNLPVRIAAMPVAVATACSAPSSAARRSSNARTVGLV